MIKKIIIAGDILRPREHDFSSSHQNENIKILYYMFQYHLTKVTGLPVEMLLWDEINGFDPKFFYSLKGLDINTDNWALLYDGEILYKNANCLKYLHKFVKDSIVIGFELSEALVAMLNKLEITYIDTTIHPVRYLDDIFLAFRTNNPDIFKELQKYMLCEDIFYIQANLHKATMSKMQGLKFDDTTALIVGQTVADRSLIYDKKIVSLLDYKDKIKELSNKYPFICYKRHPFASNDDEILDYLKTLPFVKILNLNIYHLLYHESISKICGISSSVIYEAQFFGKETEYFYKNPFKFINSEENDFNQMSYIPIFNDYFNPQFWSAILSPVIKTEKYKVKNLHLAEKPSRLRIIFQAFWAYNFLDTEITIRNTLQCR